MEEDEIKLIEKGLSMTFDDCETEFSVVPVNDIKETEKFIKGDHWQERNGWVGWVPESSSAQATNTMLFIEKTFNAKNVIGGMVKRLKGAIAGQQPDFSIVPIDKAAATPAELNTYAQMDVALNEWFTQKDVHDEIKKFVHNRTAHGKGMLRIHIPIGLLVKDGKEFKVNATDFKSALDHIYVKAHEADKFTDGDDVVFGEKYSIVKLAGNQNPSDKELDKYSFEISFVDKEKKTVIRTVERDKPGQIKKLDLGGRPLHLVKGKYDEAIISPTIKRQQKAVNCAKTNENLAGNNINFPETTIIDAELPTRAVLQPNGKTKQEEYLPQGMGVFRKLWSRVIQDAEGGDRAVQAQVIQRQQADPEYFARIANNNTRDMHQEAGMLYIYLADSEYASGDAKIEAMADYLILVIDNSTELDVVGTWLGYTVTRLAMRFSGQEDYKNKFTFFYKSKLTLGRLTVEERKLMLEEVKAMVRSRRSYQVNAGVSDDPAKEDIAIEQEFNKMSDDEKQILYALMKKEEVKPAKSTGAVG